eukprot:scaffold1306_cov399-Prasinococcus_capsulatus_cf.AAC.1
MEPDRITCISHRRLVASPAWSPPQELRLSFPNPYLAQDGRRQLQRGLQSLRNYCGCAELL